MPRCRTLLGFALKMSGKLLHFVQRGRILLRCGSAFALSLPSLGVSSLDLGRLFIQAALFSFREASSFRGARSANPESRDWFARFRVQPCGLPRNDVERPR